jgi:predicted RNA-binding Zn ribbon-like protein
MTLRQDPRPLTTEPLPLDLLNTVWVEGERRDLLAEEGGVGLWLRHHQLDPPSDPQTRAALVESREAMRDFLTDPSDHASRARLDTVLARGAERPRIDRSLIRREIEVPAAWQAAWLAAVEALHLFEHHPSRIRRCANPDCVLWFLDVSRPGTRRWCSMAACGNREKSRRHYAPTPA